MSEFKMHINVTASIVLTIAFTLFMLFVFGRKNSKIYDLPWYKTIAVKAGLALCTAGALMNCLTFSDPPVSEVVLNIGLAMMFAWASWFHYKNFVIPYKNGTHAVKSKTTKKMAAKKVKPSLK